jgi:CSLREA domain-containing protein
MKTLSLGLFALAAVTFATAASAVSFTVNSTADVVDAMPGNGVCATATGACTVRAAIQEANALAGADSITIPAGTFKLNIPGHSEDAAAAGDLDITDDVTITGAGRAGANKTVIDGNAVDRVFDIFSPATVTISGLIIRGGLPDADGGGVRNSAITILTDVTLTKNRAGRASISGDDGGDGGAVANFDGMLTLSNAAITSNHAGDCSGNSDEHCGDAGGIYNDCGSVLILTDVLISGNSAGDGHKLLKMAGCGGGLDTCGGATLTNVIISGNRAGNGDTACGGGGIANGGPTTLTNVTISGNSGGNASDSASDSAGPGGGILSFDSMTLTNVTISNNSAGKNPLGRTYGGGIFEAGGGDLLTNVTICGNRAGKSLGGGVAFSSALGWTNVLLANNIGGNCDPGSSFSSGGHNLDSGTTCSLSEPGDLSNVNPRLGALKNNGGPTKTRALLAGSPAMDAGDPTTCPGTDQRGFPRLTDGKCDIGAYEVQP